MTDTIQPTPLVETPQTTELETQVPAAEAQAIAPETTSPANDDNVPATVPTDIDLQAQKAALVASGNTQLRAIYEMKVKNSHGKIAELVAQAMSAVEKLENWTHEEVIKIWERIEKEITSI